MSMLQQGPKEFNRTDIVAAVGKGPVRQSDYGTSIDVVRTDGGQRVWGDLVPTNPEIMSQLRCGACIEVFDVELIRNGRRPLWRGQVRLIER